MAIKVLITGASSGIGAELARAYAMRYPGACLGLVARREGHLRALAATLPGTDCLVMPVDLAEAGAFKRAAELFTERWGTPDIVIANAGISVGTATGNGADAAVFRRVIDVNLTAMMETFEPFVGPMSERGSGALVGISSIAGLRGVAGAGAYSASKAGVIAYLESLRIELRSSGVRVLTITPGFIRTPMTAQNAFPMPFLTDADVFAARAVSAIGRKRGVVVIPWQMACLARILRLVPSRVYEALSARAPRKARAHNELPRSKSAVANSADPTGKGVSR